MVQIQGELEPVLEYHHRGAECSVKQARSESRDSGVDNSAGFLLWRVHLVEYLPVAVIQGVAKVELHWGIEEAGFHWGSGCMASLKIADSQWVHVSDREISWFLERGSLFDF